MLSWRNLHVNEVVCYRNTSSSSERHRHSYQRVRTPSLGEQVHTDNDRLSVQRVFKQCRACAWKTLSHQRRTPCHPQVGQQQWQSEPAQLGGVRAWEGGALRQSPLPHA